jgi:hypothetical protein
MAAESILGDMGLLGDGQDSSADSNTDHFVKVASAVHRQAEQREAEEKFRGNMGDWRARRGGEDLGVREMERDMKRVEEEDVMFGGNNEVMRKLVGAMKVSLMSSACRVPVCMHSMYLPGFDGMYVCMRNMVGVFLEGIVLFASVCV